MRLATSGNDPISLRRGENPRIGRAGGNTNLPFKRGNDIIAFALD
jgi:hypothetical protein